MSFCRHFLPLIATLSLITPDDAASQTVTSDPFRADFFTTDQGLPGHQIHDIAQTPDGFLWVTTNNGITRFDGFGFTTFADDETGLPDGHLFTDLHIAPGDTLFASSSLGYVARYADGSFSPSLLDSGTQIGEIARDRTGRWLATSFNDLVSRVTGRFVVHSRGVLATNHPKTVVDSEGAVWTVVREGRATGEPASDGFVVVRVEEGQLIPMGSSLFAHNVVMPDRGEVLLSRRRGNAVEFSNIRGEIRGVYTVPSSAFPLLIDRTGHLWVFLDRVIQSYAPGLATPVFQVPALEGGVRAWIEDREGNLWIGTVTDGLIRIRRNPFDVYSAVDETQVLSIVQGTGGSVLAVFGTSNAAYRIDDGKISPVMRGVAGLYEAADGGLLFHRVTGGVPPVALMRRIDGEERSIGHSIGGVLYQQFHPDPRIENQVWTHDGATVYRIDDPFGEAPEMSVVLDGLSDVRYLLRARSGALWIAAGIGLVRLTDEGTVHYTEEDGLPSSRIRTVLEDDDGTLWIGTYGHGLVRFRDGQFRTVTTKDGLGEDVVSFIVEDDKDNFWMSGNQGIHRTSRPEINAFLDGQRDDVTSVVYGRESGLLNPEASGFAGLNASDGRLWFPTFRGAAVVDPVAALSLERHTPLVHVTGVQAGDDLLPNRGLISLESDQRRLEIHYIGLSLRHPERVTYRYRLSGFDDDWIDAGSSRSAVYTNVTAGTHTFHVQARSFGGVWSEIDDTLTVHVARLAHETWWFYVLVGFGFLGLGAVVFRRRVRTLEARQQALQALVEERTKALVDEKELVAAQAEQLRALDQAKSRLFANVSHELRTPLTLILGPLEDVQDGRHGPLADGVRRHIGTAIRSGRRLLGLVNQLLDISRLESGRMELKARECDLGEFVKRVLQAFEPLGERRRINLRFERPSEPVPVFIDPEQMEKVLSNLLGNALKFTPDGGAVTVSLESESADSRHEGFAVLRVRDNGPGILPEQLPHVFERFYQGDASSTRRQQGTGIGLAIVRSLVELHHGTVAVESLAGHGTTFTVHLRLGDAHLGPGEREEHAPGGAGPEISTLAVMAELDIPVPDATVSDAATSENFPTTVLVVDDNSDIRDYVRRHLAPRYRVVEAVSGKDALAQARQFTPDLILSDVMMPEMNGYELCRAVRTDPELAFVPVILLTARASIDSRLAGLEDGADDYITKPFNARELVIRVENLIASRQRFNAMAGGGADRDSNPGPPGHVSFVALVRSIISERLSQDDFGVDALAAALGLGRSTLYERLSDALDTSPMDLIWRMRLEQGAGMLQRREGNVSEIAYAVGFKSVGHFSRRFRMEYGCSPTEFANRSGTIGD